MSQLPDPDFLPSPPAAPPATSSNVFGGLDRALEEYCRALTDARATGWDRCAEGLVRLRQCEQGVRDCLHALGWRPVTGEPEPPAGGPDGTAAAAAGSAGGEWRPAWAAAALVDQLVAADRDSKVLCERIQEIGDPGGAGILRAARRCHGLVADALLIGAVDLAVRLRIPDVELPL